MNPTNVIEKKIKQAEAKLAEVREWKRKETAHQQVLALHGCYVKPVNSHLGQFGFGLFDFLFDCIDRIHL
jgi:hypothetical protein